MIILIIVLGILAIGGFYAYLFHNKWFTKHQGIVEYEGILWSLIIALITISQTQSGIDSSTKDFNNLVSRLDTIVTRVDSATNSVTKVRQSLSELPPQIDKFAKSIKSMNDIIIKQKEDLSKTLVSFNQSIHSFSSSVDSMVVRFNRKPDIKFDIKYTENDTSFIVNEFVYTNWGSLMADAYMVSLQIPKKYFFNIGWEGSYKDSSQDVYFSYKQRFDQMKYRKDRLNHLLIIVK